MNLSAYIPGSDAWNEARFRKYLNAIQGDGEVLLQIEWPDGSLSYEPGRWRKEYNAYQGMRSEYLFFSRGKGRRKLDFGANTIVPVYAPNAGLMSTEAIITADRRDAGEYRVVEKQENGGVVEYERYHDKWLPVGEDPPVVDPNDESADLDSEANGSAVADGGTTLKTDAQLGIDDKLLSMAPPSATFNVSDGEVVDLEYDYDGEVKSLKQASDYDPNPVEQDDLRSMMKLIRAGAEDEDEKVQYLLMGIAVGAGGVFLFLIGMWLMNQIGGGGGVSLPLTVAPLLRAGLAGMLGVSP